MFWGYRIPLSVWFSHLFWLFLFLFKEIIRLKNELLHLKEERNEERNRTTHDRTTEVHEELHNLQIDFNELNEQIDSLNAQDFPEQVMLWKKFTPQTSHLFCIHIPTQTRIFTPLLNVLFWPPQGR